MPNITISGPKIQDLDKKRKLVATVTDAAVEAYGIAREHIVVVIEAHPPDDVGVGGTLIIDRNR
jgi:4-oxalocrotonate tautomerase